MKPRLLLRALQCVNAAGGRMELEQLGDELNISRAELDNLIAYADDERRGLLRIWQEITTGENHVVLTAAGEKLCQVERRRPPDTPR